MPPKLAHQLKEKEQEILNKFEELGYKVILDDEKYLVLKNYILSATFYIRKLTKEYHKYDESTHCYEDVTFQEHQLLTELFKCWGWFDE